MAAKLYKVFVSHTKTYSSREFAKELYPFTKEERDAIEAAINALNEGYLRDKIQLKMLDMDNLAGPSKTDADFFIRVIRECNYFIGIVEYDGISRFSKPEYEEALKRRKTGSLREVFMFVHTEGEQHSEINAKTFFSGSSRRNPWVNEYENAAILKERIKNAFERHYALYEKRQKRRRILIGLIVALSIISFLCIHFRGAVNKWFHPDNTQQIDSTLVIEPEGDNNNGIVSRKEVKDGDSGSHDSSSSRPPITDGNKGRASGKQEDKVNTSESSGTSESSQSTEPETVEITPCESFEDEVAVPRNVIAEETIAEVPKLNIGDNIEVIPGLKETIVLLSSNGNSGYVMYHKGRHASEFLPNLDIALYYGGCVYPTIEELMEIYKHRAAIGVWSGIIRSGTPAGRNEHFALDFSNGEKIAVKDKRTDVYNLLIRHFAK